MSSSGPAAQSRRLLEKGLALYGKGDVVGAVRCWLAARELDPASRRAEKYLAFARNHDGIDPASIPPEPDRIELDPEPIGPRREVVVPEYIPNPPEGTPGAWTPVYTTPAPTPEVPVAELQVLRSELQDRLRQDDFSGALDIAEKMLALDPRDAEARAAAQRASENLLRMLEAKIGDLGAVPVVKIPADEVIWLNLSHREGFVLSQVDGAMRYEDILDVCGMPRLEALKILASLVADGVIGPA